MGHQPGTQRRPQVQDSHRSPSALRQFPVACAEPEVSRLLADLSCVVPHFPPGLLNNFYAVLPVQVTLLTVSEKEAMATKTRVLGHRFMCQLMELGNFAETDCPYDVDDAGVPISVAAEDEASVGMGGGGRKDAATVYIHWMAFHAADSIQAHGALGLYSRECLERHNSFNRRFVRRQSNFHDITLTCFIHELSHERLRFFQRQKAKGEPRDRTGPRSAAVPSEASSSAPIDGSPMELDDCDEPEIEDFATPAHLLRLCTADEEAEDPRIN